MDLTEGIFQHVAKTVVGQDVLEYDGKEINVGGKFKRVHMVDAIKEVAGVDFWPEMTFERKSKRSCLYFGNLYCHVANA